MGEIVALVAALFFSFQAIFVRRGLMEENAGDSVAVNLIAMLGGTILFVAGLLLSPLFGFDLIGSFATLSTENIFYIIGEGILGPLSGIFLFILAIGQIGASRASILRMSNPFFVAVLSVIFLNERVDLRGILALFLLIAGVILVVYRSEGTAVALQPKTKVAGNFIALFCGFSFAVSQIFRAMAIQNGASNTAIVLIGNLTAILFLSMIWWFRKGSFKPLLKINGQSLKFYLAAGIVTIAGRYLLLVSFTLTQVWIAVAIRNTQPLIVLLFSWIFLSRVERITWRLVVGACIVLCGLYLLM